MRYNKIKIGDVSKGKMKMTAQTKSKWIWITEDASSDTYGEFLETLRYEKGRAVVRLSVDSDYTLYVNGEYAASGQYGDFEHYKIYDTVDITHLLRKGDNILLFIVHYIGLPTSRYLPARAGLIYEVLIDGKATAYSSRETLSRQSPVYACGEKKIITGQLGLSFFYDARKEKDGGYSLSVEIEKNCDFFPRPIKKSRIGGKIEMKSVVSFDDKHYLVDLGQETVGVPHLELFSTEDQEITVAWGEHIIDGGVRRLVGKRDFSFRYGAVKGENLFTNYMLRLGCRYIELFGEKPFELRYGGVLPDVYEVSQRPCGILGGAERKIYDICVNTLRLCMMEHYVDCPWREQALYAFDSRNQMLCGYYCFENGNRDYARANLKLIGEDRREDGLLSICYPSGTPLAIPSFSLYWIMEMKEYTDYTGDISLASELYEKMRSVLDRFVGNMEDGLVLPFCDGGRWNFYDWTEFCKGHYGVDEPTEPDAALNCLLVTALDNFEKMCEKTEKEYPYGDLAKKLRVRIRETFLTDRGVYTMRKGKEQYVTLANALAVLSGTSEGKEAEFICDAIRDGRLADCSLSMKILVYEALMAVDEKKYGDYILGDILKNYKPMLDAGSDTVWETALGASDFHNAGSLCHGWSAVPVYVYHKFGVASCRKTTDI